MRLLFVCPNMDQGGAEHQWACLLDGLAARGHDVRLLTLDGEGPFFAARASHGVAVSCARLKSRFDLAGIVRAFRTARAFRPDVVVTRGVSAQCLAVPGAALLRVPHVTTMHAGRRLTLAPHRRALARLSSSQFDGIVAVAADQLEGLGVPEERVRVIPNAVDEAELRPSVTRAEMRARLGLEENQFAALLVANLRPEKRVDVFVEAIAEAAEREPGIVGLVAGDGALRDSLETVAGDKPVRFLGRRNDIADLLAAADVLCLTSDTEALPMTVLEAMAAARPVVATDVGDVGTAVAHDVSGLLVEPGDVSGIARALVGLARDPARGVELGQAGLARQRLLYGRERMLDAYEALLAELVERAPGTVAAPAAGAR